MNCIGLRASTECIYFSIVKKDGVNFEIQAMDKIFIPKALTHPKKLTYLRNTLISIFLEYNVQNASIKLNEFSKFAGPDPIRLNFEGVIQEVIANSTVYNHECIKNRTIQSRLDISNEELELMKKGNLIKLPFKENDWKKGSIELRESAIIAFSFLINQKEI